MQLRSCLALVLVASFGLAACDRDDAKIHPVPTPTSSNLASAFSCPTSDTPAAAVLRAGTAAERRMPLLPKLRYGAGASAERLVVTYDRPAAQSQATLAERTVGARLVRSANYAATGVTTRVLAVDPDRVPAAQAALGAMPGVRSVSAGGGRRYGLTVNAPYYPNNAYFQGFTDTTPSGKNPPPAPTFEVPPFAENADVPGQWEMHLIGLDRAFAYSQPGNGSAVGAVPNALGSSTETIAIIDSGVDSNHPSLAGKVTKESCFITDPNGHQSTSSFSLDPNGHGTNVSGIAAAMLGSGPFLGAGGNATILAYRVDPTPDDNCATTSGTPPPSDKQCGADTVDIAAAIDDATTSGARVISMSLGGGSCSAGKDSDAAEGAAVANAIAKGVIVVASSGNDPKSPVTAPACDTGVLAVGATALADGQPNGANNSSGLPGGNATEYVASYTSTGGPPAVRSAGAWGIVAPGGDPTGSSDPDNLHWIDNIWTTTPVSMNFSAHNCGTTGSDPWIQSSNYCSVLIAGTSMAAPQVAGAAALILAATSDAATYRSSQAMKQLLCSTADDIRDARQGCGRLNVYRAMATALRDPLLP